MAWAEPGGRTTAHAYETLRQHLLDSLREAGPVDVVLLLLHGAMLADGCDNCEADIIGAVRAIVGPQVIIGVELDLHCHLRAATLAEADLVVTYKHYPHIDMIDRGRELFELATATRRGEVAPVMATFDCHMVGFYPTTGSALAKLLVDIQAAEGRDGVLSISIAHDFPFADLPDSMARVLVVADRDRDLAARVARDFGERFYALRHEIGFDAISLPLPEALSRAADHCLKPVIVADQSDNSGAGAPGDSTYALAWLTQRPEVSAAVATVYDPVMVRIAHKIGIGRAGWFRTGGKLGRFSGDPIDLECVVTALHDDYFHEAPQNGGEARRYPLGAVAALRWRGVDIILTSERCQCFSPSLFTDFGIDIAAKQLVLVKSYQHFQAAFAPVAAEILYMSGPGAVPPDPRQISYRHLDTLRLFPWCEDPLGPGGKPASQGMG